MIRMDGLILPGTDNFMHGPARSAVASFFGAREGGCHAGRDEAVIRIIFALYISSFSSSAPPDPFFPNRFSAVVTIPRSASSFVSWSTDLPAQGVRSSSSPAASLVRMVSV